ncbi:hypothetical protein [Robertmurraya sp.]|uniref:hypothetical protein n=1 Tax=Robertmurraya sp. TaxID=2837525 RepID=UPI00370372BD
MIHAHVPTNRPKLIWQDIIKSKEDYTNLAKSGMMYVYFPDISWKEVEEYLNKEKQVVTD